MFLLLDYQELKDKWETTHFHLSEEKGRELTNMFRESEKRLDATNQTLVRKAEAGLLALDKKVVYKQTEWAKNGLSNDCTRDVLQEFGEKILRDLVEHNFKNKKPPYIPDDHNDPGDDPDPWDGKNPWDDPDSNPFDDEAPTDDNIPLWITLIQIGVIAGAGITKLTELIQSYWEKRTSDNEGLEYDIPPVADQSFGIRNDLRLDVR
jgi:hypothetical protein